MPVCLFSSCVPHTDGMFGWYNSEVWDLGHRWTGTLPQPGTDVLQRSSGRYCGLRHHQRRESHDISKDSQEWRVSRPVPVFKFGLMISETFARQLFTCVLSKWCVLKVLSLPSRIHSHVQRTGWRNCSDKPAPTSLSPWQETKQIWPTSAL